MGTNSGEPRRFLTRVSVPAYTNNPAMALPGEPEAVGAEYQAHLTAVAARRRRERDLAAWADGRRKIIDGVSIARGARLPKKIISDLRVIERQVEKVDRQLRAGI